MGTAAGREEVLHAESPDVAPLPLSITEGFTPFSSAVGWRCDHPLVVPSPAVTVSPRSRRDGTQTLSRGELVDDPPRAPEPEADTGLFLLAGDIFVQQEKRQVGIQQPEEHRVMTHKQP